MKEREIVPQEKGKIQESRKKIEEGVEGKRHEGENRLQRQKNRRANINKFHHCPPQDQTNQSINE